MRTPFWVNTLFVSLLCIAFAGGVFAQSSTTGVVAAPAYDSFVPPSTGGTYADPVFGSTIKRVSNALATTNSDQGGFLTWIENEYSTASAFNSDNSRFILLHQSYFGLYDDAGVYLHDLPLEINSSSEPRWSRKDNVTVYYHSANMLKSYNVATGFIAVVHTFSEYSSISGNGEMDISLDGDHFVFAGDNRFIFVYQVSTDSKFQVFDAAGTNFDSLYITPNNNVIVSWYPAGTGRYAGQELFDSNMNFLRQVGHSDGHKHLTRDTNGSEVLIWTNSSDPQPIANCQNGIVKILLADASQTCLAQLDWSLAVHITAADGNGSAYVETYAPANPQPSTSDWKPYTNELLQVKLDGSGVVRLAQHRSRPLNSYNYEPKMTSSRDGSRLLYASNYDLQKINGYTSEYSDTYLIVLGAQGSTSSPTSTSTPTPTQPTPTPTQPPSTPTQPPSTPTQPPSTPTSPSSGATSTVRYEQDNAAIQYSGSWYPNAGAFNSGGSAVLAMDAGSQASFTFTGTGVKWIGYGDPWSGIAQVSVDGTLVTTIDTWSASQQAQAVEYSVNNLSSGPHTLAITATGQHSAASSGAWIWVDAFDVTGVTSGGVSGTPVKSVVVNAASGGSDIAPGSLISIYGSQLASSSETASTASGPLPTELGSVTASVDGVAIPLMYVSPGQLTAQLPFGIAPGAITLMTALHGTPTSAAMFTVSATAPEVFRISGTQGLAVNQDQTVNGPAAPAPAGSVITVYFTGQAAVDNALPTGVAAPASPLARPIAAVTITLDGQPATVPFVGLTPGLVGVSQANVQIPDVAAGDHSLVVQVGDGISQAVTITVQ